MKLVSLRYAAKLMLGPVTVWRLAVASLCSDGSKQKLVPGPAFLAARVLQETHCPVRRSCTCYVTFSFDSAIV